ncbi:ferritin-like protein [Sedimentitalea sp.]|uniref:ferritin-like domain-containing protein n=1 Tax=Sedimentitalea sp. TaxID=2048915 RepID=UPI003298CC2F
MKIARQHMDQVIQATTVADILPVVQKVIELEHATIPPYLCGYFTIQQASTKTTEGKPTGNGLAADIIRSVVVEEMLHLTIACNLMNALGGNPSIDSPSFVPDYPGELPFGIGDHFLVHLRSCSVAQVRDVFMKIEEPEHPIDVPVLERLAAGIAIEEDLTIGTLYMALSKKLKELEAQAQAQGKTIFTGDGARQVVPLQWFDASEIWAIKDLKSAQAGIALIVDQGEGTTTDPFDTSDQPAHYYRFEQIVEGKMLEPRPDDDPPYAFSGEAVALDTSKIYDMDENPKIAHYKEGTYSRRMATQFCYNYTKLLRSLHDTFNGNPAGIDRSMGGMYELRFSALQALETKAEWADASKSDIKQTGLSFEYVTVNS